MRVTIELVFSQMARPGLARTHLLVQDSLYLILQKKWEVIQGAS